jgi:uncharacterized protein (DUF4415 family)
MGWLLHCRSFGSQRLDMDLIEWFKSHAPEGGYQTEINRVLWRHVAGAGR